jgi:hypothetical protein
MQQARVIATKTWLRSKCTCLVTNEEEERTDHEYCVTYGSTYQPIVFGCPFEDWQWPAHR